MIHIKKCTLSYQREPLLAPFGFKGGYLSELWQPIVKIESDGFVAVCPSVQSVLWSDARVFVSNSETDGNKKMLAITERACEMLSGQSFERPDTVTPYLAESLYDYAAKVCGFAPAKTFVLNALVGIDFALWMLYAASNGITDFDGIIPDEYKGTFDSRHGSLAHIPLVSYAVDGDSLRGLLDGGTALLKIKLGRHVEGDNGSQADMASMLEWDVNRVKQIHAIAEQYTTDKTKDGRIRYYFDANGRYDTKARFEALLDAMYGVGALKQTELIEEPFAEDNEIDVHSLGAVIGADESAHSLSDLQKRLALGYRAVALKPAAKTLSVSFAMADAAIKSGAGCLTADLTVNPLLAMWNRQFASRIKAMPGMKVGCVEVNGDQNYVNWQQMCTLLPQGLSWQDAVGGAFLADKDFYYNSGRLFGTNGYAAVFER